MATTSQYNPLEEIKKVSDNKSAQTKALFENEQFVSRYRNQPEIVPGFQDLLLILNSYVERFGKDQDRILVAGCGGGRELENFGKSSHQFTLVGFDPSEKMCELARKYVSSDASSRITIIQGLIDEVPSSAPPFQIATIIFTLHFLPDNESVEGKAYLLKEIRKRLSPGAIILITDMCIDREDATIHSPAFFEFAKHKGADCEKSWNGTPYNLPLEIISERRTTRLLEECGFGQVFQFYRGLVYAGFFAQAV